VWIPDGSRRAAEDVKESDMGAPSMISMILMIVMMSRFIPLSEQMGL
jgi:hypothetical protein